MLLLQDGLDGSFKKLGSSVKTLIRFNAMALTGPPVNLGYEDENAKEKKSVKGRFKSLGFCL